MSSRQSHVLLAEDDFEHRTLLMSALENKGFLVTTVADGAQLLAYLEGIVLRESFDLAHDLTPDVIVSDVRMPGETGIDVVTALRESGWHIPVILITAFGDGPLHERALRLEAELLDKPFAMEALLASIRRAIEADTSSRPRCLRLVDPNDR